MAERLEISVRLPVVDVPAVAGVTGVDSDHHSRLVDQSPERIEPGVGGRGPAGWREGRSPLDADHAGVGGQDPFQLVHRRPDVDQGEHGGGEDALLVGVAPVVLQPPVERTERGHQRLGVVDQCLLHADPEGGEEQAPVQTLFVHDGQPRVAVPVLGTYRLQLPEQRPHVLGPRVAATEVLVEAAGLGHRVEQWVGDELVDRAAHQQPPPSVDLRPLHGPLGHLRIDVAGVGVGGLVVMVVGVEGDVVDRPTGPALLRGRISCVPRSAGKSFEPQYPEGVGP